MSDSSRTWRPERCDRVALVLQGGGRARRLPGGRLSGHARSRIRARLGVGRIDWRDQCGHHRRQSAQSPPASAARVLGTDHGSARIWPFTPDGDVFRKARNATSCWLTMVNGQPGFVCPALSQSVAELHRRPKRHQLLSIIRPCRRPCRKLVDFSLLNDRSVRFSVGAVNVLTGNFIYFDNADEQIEPAHVMASGALPPALPNGQDRNRSLLGRRHRIEHPAAAPARSG